jgi:hypothetical protein
MKRLTGCFPIIKKSANGVFTLSYWLYLPFFTAVITLCSLAIVFYENRANHYGVLMFINVTVLRSEENPRIPITDAATNNVNFVFLAICLVATFIANHHLFKTVLETNIANKPNMKGESIKLMFTYLVLDIIHVFLLLGIRLSLNKVVDSHKFVNILSIIFGLFAMVWCHVPLVVAEILFRFFVTFVTKELKNGQKIDIILSKLDKLISLKIYLDRL